MSTPDFKALLQAPPALDVDAEIAAGKALLLSLPDVAKFALIGSASFMPADQVNDIDFAVLLKPGVTLLDTFNETLTVPDGWWPCGEYDTTEAFEWAAVRRGNLNLMLSSSEKFYDGYLRAMEVIKALTLTNKDHRILVCSIIRDGKSARDWSFSPHWRE